MRRIADFSEIGLRDINRNFEMLFNAIAMTQRTPDRVFSTGTDFTTDKHYDMGEHMVVEVDKAKIRIDYEKIITPTSLGSGWLTEIPLLDKSLIKSYTSLTVGGV